MCKKKDEAIEVDPAVVAKYGVTLDELKDIMELKSAEATEKIKEKYGSVTGLAAKLNSNIVAGLSGSVQDISERQMVFGKNEIPPKEPKWFIQLAFEALQDFTLIILLVCAVLSIGLSFYHPPEDGVSEESFVKKEENLEWVEGIAILIAVIVVVFVTSFNDWTKERQFRGLQDRIEKENFASVVRNSEVMQIAVKDLVVGDVCCIKYGDLLQADGFVLQSSDLKIDESALTGETDLIKKNDHSNAVLLSGTHVMEGSGKFLVTAVGLNSQNGIIFALLGATKVDKPKPQKKNEGAETVLPKDTVAEVNGKKVKEEKKEGGGGGKQNSVLQSKLTKITIQIGYFGIGAALFTIFVLCLRLGIDEFIVKKNVWSNNYFKYLISYLISGITVLVVTVPEGLPLAVALALAFAVKKMTFDNNLVRHLYACETMGSATTICSDKTGTLTTNRMTAVQCWIGGQLHKTIPGKDQVLASIKDTIADAISINSGYTSRLEAPKQPGELPKQLGNKTECGLLGFVVAMGVDYDAIRTAHPVEKFTKVYTFNSARKMMGTIIENPKTNGYRLFAKGASEMVLYKCSHYVNWEGRIEAFGAGEVDGIVKNVVEEMASEGLRTICVAYRDFAPSNGGNRDYNMNISYYEDTPDWEQEDEMMSNLTCACILGIEDPVRNEVPDAIRKCQSSGVTVRMVTGDNVNTATSIALKCGIIKPGDNFLVLESKEFNKRIRDASGNVSQDLFDQVWPNLRVLARSSPQDKHILVNGIVESKLSANREVVAVTGDGTNDGPALKRADVGFAMGIQGTDVAKEASDIILTDDNFSSIVKAMMWGRNVHDSIAKFLQFQLTVNLIAALLSIICAATIRTVPLKAVQMLWVNLVMDTLGALALATEPPTDELLKRKPYGRQKPIVSPIILRNLVGQGIYQLSIILALVWAIEDWTMIDSVVKYNDLQKLKGGSQHFTMIFNAFVMMTLFNEINARKINGERNVFADMWRNPYYYIIWIICFVTQVIIVQFGSIVFAVEALEFDHWVWCLMFGVGTLLWHQVVMSVPVSFIENLTFGKSNGKVDNVKTNYNVNNESNNNNNNSANDLEKMVQSKVLWLRGIGRIHHQLDVISAFKTRMEETKSRSVHGSNVSLKELKEQLRSS